MLYFHEPVCLQCTSDTFIHSPVRWSVFVEVSCEVGNCLSQYLSLFVTMRFRDRLLSRVEKSHQISPKALVRIRACRKRSTLGRLDPTNVKSSLLISSWHVHHYSTRPKLCFLLFAVSSIASLYHMVGIPHVVFNSFFHGDHQVSGGGGGLLWRWQLRGFDVAFERKISSNHLKDGLRT